VLRHGGLYRDVVVVGKRLDSASAAETLSAALSEVGSLLVIPTLYQIDQ